MEGAQCLTSKLLDFITSKIVASERSISITPLLQLDAFKFTGKIPSLPGGILDAIGLIVRIETILKCLKAI